MQRVRILGALGVTLAAMTGGAQASSIVVLGVSTSTPSIVVLGASEPAGPSIVALGDPEPYVTDEKVAAIPDKPEHKHGFMRNPMVIRGGIAGDAFASPTPAAAPAKSTATAAAAPAAGTEPAADTKPAGTAAASNGTPQPETQPEPATQQPTQIPAVGKAM
jgi:hypothetical protein